MSPHLLSNLMIYFKQHAHSSIIMTTIITAPSHARCCHCFASHNLLLSLLLLLPLSQRLLVVLWMVLIWCWRGGVTGNVRPPPHFEFIHFDEMYRNKNKKKVKRIDTTVPVWFRVLTSGAAAQQWRKPTVVVYTHFAINRICIYTTILHTSTDANTPPALSMLSILMLAIDFDFLLLLNCSVHHLLASPLIR